MTLIANQGSRIKGKENEAELQKMSREVFSRFVARLKQTIEPAKVKHISN